MAAPPQNKKPKSRAVLGGGCGGAASEMTTGLFTSIRDRRAPPALFLHPSPQASHVSIPGIHSVSATGITSTAPSTATNATTVGAPPSSTSPTDAATTTTGSSSSAAQRSVKHKAQASNPRRTGPAASGAAPVVAASGGGGSTGTASQPQQAHLHPTPSINTLSSHAPPLIHVRSADRTDALWAEMQTTLEEVQFSASGSTHVFRTEHEKKLSDLRAAQIALAQAWARSEADDIDAEASAAGMLLTPGGIDGVGLEVRNMAKSSVMGSETGGDGATTTEQAKSVASGAPPSSAGAAAGGPPPGFRIGRMEEETEFDVLLARKRREANDRYFQRVNQGVVDVVAKLADVADAMRKVEAESKDIWGENDSGSFIHDGS